MRFWPRFQAVEREPEQSLYLQSYDSSDTKFVMTEFMRGRELSRLFYEEIVGPILSDHFGNGRHTACLIGAGSEVLGYDNEESMDHEWGPRLQVFLSDNDWTHRRDEIEERLQFELPRTFRGFSTSFSEPDEEGVRIRVDIDDGPVRHEVRISTLKQFFMTYLGTDPFRETSLVEWLTFSEQFLLSITRAAVYHDDLGLGELQDKFRYYPRDVSLYLLASQWRRLDQMEPLMGRSGNLGDELGSKLIAHQIVLDLVRLCFLMEKRYAPYAKWLGTAFRELVCAHQMAPIMAAVLASKHWREREDHLSEAYALAARLHNDLHITEPLDASVRPFHNRPYRVIGAQRFAQAIVGQIVDPRVRELQDCLGSVDQISHSVDILTRTQRWKALRGLYKKV